MEEKEYRPAFAKWLFLYVVPPIAILIIGAAGILTLAEKMKPKAEESSLEPVLPSVETMVARPETKRVIVESQGTVEARTHTVLIAEVSGRIESVSPALYAGSFFSEGDTLAKIDDTDYRANLAAAKSRLADAQLAYQQELAASEQAMEDWKALGNQGAPSDLVLRKPQLERALANLDAAKAAAKSAERDLERTTVKAPYDGRVQQKFVDLGQFANARASQIASIYSIDTAEIRLGISLDETRLVNLPESFVDGSVSGPKPKVTITATYGGKDYQWDGVIDRSEGSIDPQTRLLYLVAQIENPYAKATEGQRPPLKIGSFVRAEIEGELIEDAYVIPRRALRENDTIYIVDPEGKLEVRQVTPFQRTKTIVILRDGLAAGELICLTPLQYVVNGMEVEISSDEPTVEPEATESL